MSFFATCAGLQIVGGSLMIPLVGTWTADLELATDQQVSGAVEVVIGNLTLQGFVYRAEAYGGQVHARLIGGAGGWRQPLKPQGYGSSGGVKLSTVLQDLASSIGEKINVVADTNIGTAFARLGFSSSVASDVLWQMVSQGLIPAWYVDPTGTTQTASWPTTTINTPFTATNQKPDQGMIEIATEDYASWMPGCSFTSPLLAGTWTAAGVHYVWTNDGSFRFEVLTATTDGSDRILGPLKAIIQKETAPTRYYGRYEYTISNPSSTSIDGSPCDTALGLPDLQAVPLTGDSLSSYTPPDGGKAHIMFLDGVPTKPVCVWTEATADNGPTDITLGPQGSGVGKVARVSDTVIVMFPPLMQIAGTISGAPFIGVLTITTPGIGSISTGSSLVGAAQS